MERKEFRDLASPAEVEAAIDTLELGSGVETVTLRRACGRILAERLDAPLDVPGFDRATLDGYAVRAADTVGADEMDPAQLSVVDAVHAGDRPDTALDAGEAIEISTGAVMPPGATAMIPVERTDRDDDIVRVRTAVAPGENVMVAGADIAAGERALGPGTELTPRTIGLLAALGIERVPVRERPPVGIISTGDELVRPGQPLDHERGEIYDVNTATMAAAVEAAGGTARVFPHAGDDRDRLERTLRDAAAGCDLVLSSGSTSASAVDVIYRVVEETGEVLLHGASLKPGKPLLVGRLDDAGYVGLPGYPVSALMVFRRFVAPALRAAIGRPEPPTVSRTGRMATEARFSEGRQRLLPVGLVRDGAADPLVYPADKGSGATTTLAEADGLVVVPASTDYVGAGEQVEVTLFTTDASIPTLLAVGASDPTAFGLMDHIERPRYLAIGSRPAPRRLRDGIADVAVVAGDHAVPEKTTTLGRWERTWGLLHRPSLDQPNNVAALVDGEYRFANRSRDSALRMALDARLEELAADREVERASLTRNIDGYGRTLMGYESPANAILSGRADVGLGLEVTATSGDLSFVELGTQQVTVSARQDRLEKESVRTLQAELAARGVAVE